MKKQSFWQKLFGTQPASEKRDQWVGNQELPLREASAAKREQTRRAAQALREQQNQSRYDLDTSNLNALLLAQQIAAEQDAARDAGGSKHETHHSPSPTHTSHANQASHTSHATHHSDHNSWGGGHHVGGHDFGGGGGHSFDGGGGGFSGGDGGGGSF